MILHNRRISVREVADAVGISFGLCQVIITYVLGMIRAAAKIVPKLLNFKHRSADVDDVQRKYRFAQDRS